MSDVDALIRDGRAFRHSASVRSTGDLVAALADALEASAARADQLEKAMRDFEQHGLRCDLNPTMHLADVSSLYSDFVRYLARADEAVRARARAALARVPTEPATEEKVNPDCRFVRMGDRYDCATCGGGRGAPLDQWCDSCKARAAP